MAGPEVRFREGAEPGIGRHSQFGPEGPRPVAAAGNAEPGRLAGQDRQPAEVEAGPAQRLQIEVLADLRHQADTAGQHRGRGDGGRVAGSAQGSAGAVRIRIRGPADVTDQDQPDGWGVVPVNETMTISVRARHFWHSSASTERYGST